MAGRRKISKEARELIVYLRDKLNLKWYEISNQLAGKGYYYSPQSCRSHYRRTKKPQLQKPSNPYERYERNTVIKNGGNVLIIGDTHEPFVLSGYLEFCAYVRDYFDCEVFVHIGDLVDQCAISRFASDPDGDSPIKEYKKARKNLQKWYNEFPVMNVCIGNHDKRYFKAAFNAKIPRHYLKPYEETWNCPSGWRFGLSWTIDNVIYEHGSGTGGKYPAMTRAEHNLQSTVMGHIHTAGGVWWKTSRHNKIFGLSVGCGMDDSAYAAHYAQELPRKSTIGCGVVLENGTFPIFVPMNS